MPDFKTFWNTKVGEPWKKNGCLPAMTSSKAVHFSNGTSQES